MTRVVNPPSGAPSQGMPFKWFNSGLANLPVIPSATFAKNLTSSNTVNLKRSINAVINQTADGFFFFDGDSLTAGQGDNSPAGSSNGLLTKAYARRIEALLATRFGFSTRHDSYYGSTGNPSASYITYDPRWAVSGGDFSGSVFSLGGAVSQAFGAGWTQLTPGSNYDRCEYLLVDVTSTPTAVTVNPAPVTGITTPGVSGTLMHGTLSFAAPHTFLQFGPNVQVIGFRTWLSTDAKKLNVGIAGYRGTTTATFVPNPSVNGYEAWEAVNALAPDVLFMNLLTNDTLNLSQGQFSANVNLIISRCLNAGTDVIFTIPHWRASSDKDGVGGAPTSTTIQAFGDTIRNNCTSANLPWWDVAAAQQSQATTVGAISPFAAWNQRSFMFDNLHPNDAGYNFYATWGDQFIAAAYAA